MYSFFWRLGYYCIGIALGVVLLSFIFKEKKTSFCYFPNCRVLKEIRSYQLVFPDEFSTSMHQEVVEVLLREGDVDFSKSEVHTQPCKKYYIEGEVNGQHKTIEIKICTNNNKAEVCTIH